MSIYFTGQLEITQRNQLYSLLERARWFLAEQKETIDVVDFLEKVVKNIFAHQDFSTWADRITTFMQCNGQPFMQSAVDVLHRIRQERQNLKHQQQRLERIKPMVVRYEPVI
jgi:hypothetical protein